MPADPHAADSNGLISLGLTRASTVHLPSTLYFTGPPSLHLPQMARKCPDLCGADAAASFVHTANSLCPPGIHAAAPPATDGAPGVLRNDTQHASFIHLLTTGIHTFLPTTDGAPGARLG
jgi:hypothetical protein